MSVVWLNGALVDERSAAVPVHDRGFTLGDGLFETLRAYNGRAFRLRDHLHRLGRAAARVELPLPGGLEAAVQATLAANGLSDAAVRLTVSRGPGGDGLAPPDPVEPTVVVTARPYSAPERGYTLGLRAVLARGRINEHAPTAGLKRLGYLDSVVALAEARAAGAEDALFLDTAGHLAEATASNVFLVRAGALRTPLLSCGILPGITRATVLELAAEAGIVARETTLALDEIASADEAFLTSSLRELVPLVAVDGREIGSGRAGALTRRLIAAYRERVGAETGAD